MPSDTAPKKATNNIVSQQPMCPWRAKVAATSTQQSQFKPEFIPAYAECNKPTHKPDLHVIYSCCPINNPKKMVFLFVDTNHVSLYIIIQDAVPLRLKYAVCRWQLKVVCAV